MYKNENRRVITLRPFRFVFCTQTSLQKGSIYSHAYHVNSTVMFFCVMCNTLHSYWCAMHCTATDQSTAN